MNPFSCTAPCKCNIKLASRKEAWDNINGVKLYPFCAVSGYCVCQHERKLLIGGPVVQDYGFSSDYGGLFVAQFDGNGIICQSRYRADTPVLILPITQNNHYAHPDRQLQSSGYLSKCMRASMAIPGAFKPVEINGRTLVDGGMLNNLPVDVVKAMGADVVVAIDLTQNKHETRDFSLKEITGIGGILDWAVSRPDWKKYNENVKMVDVHINPNLAGYGATSFGKKSIDEMIKIGEQVGRKNRARLEALKKKVRGER